MVGGRGFGGYWQAGDRASKLAIPAPGPPNQRSGAMLLAAAGAELQAPFLHCPSARPARYFCIKVRGSVRGCTVPARAAAIPIAASSL